MRKLLLLIVSLLLFTGSLVATLGTAQIRDFELRGYVNPTKDQNLPFATARPGVNVELLQYDQQDLLINLQSISDANFHWIRQFVYWDEIEASQGEFDWSNWDRLASAVRTFPQLELVAVLMNTPEWARAKQDELTLKRSAPPEHLENFAFFAGEFASRYGDFIDNYQIWDEPNLGDAWGGLDPRPAEYVALLSTARAAILAADGNATILAAALAPTTEVAGKNISDIRYLDAIYAHGAAELMDVVAGKPYGFSSSALDRRVDETLLNFSRIIALREVMLAHNDGRTPLWASHFGWNALPTDWQGDASIWGAVSEEQQREYTLQALDRSYRELPWLGALILHHWQPQVAPSSAQWGFSLHTQAGEPSPLLTALQNYQHPERAQNGLYHARNPHARYSGIWQFSEMGADIGWLDTSDSQLDFDFFGSDLAMLLNEDDYIAFLYPTIDGEPANATQRDSSGNAYIFLRSDSRKPETNLVPIAAGLPLAAHKLHVIADRGWDRWAIAGYAVSSGDLADVYDRQISLGILATVITSVTLCLTVLTSPWRDWLPVLALVQNGLSATAHLLLTGFTSIFMMLAMFWTWDSPRPSIFLRDEVNLLLALLTGGALYLSPSFLLSILFGLILFLLILHRLENGLVLTLLWAPFFDFPVSLHIYAFAMVEVMILVTAAAGFVKLMVALGRQLQLENSAFPLFSRALLAEIRAMDLTVIALAILSALSLLWADLPETAQTELRKIIIQPLLFYLVLRCLRPNRATLLRLFSALILAAVLVSLIGLYQYFIENSWVVAEAGSLRLDSVYGSPNNVGLLLDRVIPLALAFTLVNFNARLRWLSAISLVIMFPTLLLTQSVGAIMLGVPAAIVLVLLALYRGKAILPVSGVIALGVASFGILSRISARFANVLDFSSGTNFLRLRQWESSLAIIRDFPLTGIGLDQYLYRYGGEYLRPDAIWDRDLSHPHNAILDFWVRLGILGVLIFLAIQVIFWRSAIFALNHFRIRDPLLFAMSAGLMGSMAGLLAHGLIDNSVFVIDLAVIFMFQLAVVVRLVELAETTGT